MCGINAVVLADQEASASSELYEGLSILQHRGQDAAGIITNGSKGRLYQCKGNGMVRDIFDEHSLLTLLGNQGIGHCRYPTAGTTSLSEVQPFYVNAPYGIVLAHNGNLTNTRDLAKYLDTTAHRHINTDSDSECLLNVFAECLSQAGKVRVNDEDVFKAVQGTMSQISGGYACLAMIPGFGVIAFRDVHGIRPLVYGSRPSKSVEGRMDYMFASESVVLDVLGYRDVKDIQPGQAIIVTAKNGLSQKQCCEVDVEKIAPCIFEYVYFARPDSIINGICVYKSRLAMGESLASQVIKHFHSTEQDIKNLIDVVIPVPDTSRVAALQLSYKLGIVYREGFIKNRYVGRTFIMPGQSQRIKSVRRKLNPMRMEFQGKNVLLVDDSVVRGTTSKEIINMARESGAKKVYFASCAPPIRFPNVYGIDMPTKQELVAYGRTELEVAQCIGADELIYQNLEDLVKSCSQLNANISRFDVSVFNGDYVTGDVTAEYLQELEQFRGKLKEQHVTVNSATMNGSEATSPIEGSRRDQETIGLFNSYYRK